MLSTCPNCRKMYRSKDAQPRRGWLCPSCLIRELFEVNGVPFSDRTISEFIRFLERAKAELTINGVRVVMALPDGMEEK